MLSAHDPLMKLDDGLPLYKVAISTQTTTHQRQPPQQEDKTMPLSNVCLVVTPANLAAFKTYYKAVLAPLGYGVWREDDKFIGFRQGEHDPDFFMIAKPESERLPTRNVHFGFRAASTEVVKAFHAAAL